MLDPSDLPLCAVCGVRVASLEVVFSPAANRGLGGHSLVAHCHGERDVVDISEHDLASMLPGTVRAGVAFQRGGFVGRAVSDRDADGFVELDLRDTAFRMLREPPPRGPAMLRLAGDELDAWSYAAHGVRRYEPPEGSG